MLLPDPPEVRVFRGLLRVLVGQVHDPHVGKHLLHPTGAHRAGNTLALQAAHDHRQIGHIPPGEIDQVLVPQGRRMELPQHQAGRAFRVHFLAHSTRPMTASTKRTRYRRLVRYSLRRKYTPVSTTSAAIQRIQFSSTFHPRRYCATRLVTVVAASTYGSAARVRRFM